MHIWNMHMPVRGHVLFQMWPVLYLKVFMLRMHGYGIDPCVAGPGMAAPCPITASTVPFALKRFKVDFPTLYLLCKAFLSESSKSSMQASTNVLCRG